MTPPPFLWPQALESEDLFVHQWIQQRPILEQAYDIVLFGVPLSRSSISISGASDFPEAFRRSWKGFSTYNFDYDLDLKELSIGDLGDVKMHVTDIRMCHNYIMEAMKEICHTFPHAIPVAIGGDHSITAMLVKGLKECEKEKEIGILQFDTHLDVRSLKENGPSNGTPIRNLIESGTVKGENVYNVGLHGFFNAPSLVRFAKEQGIHSYPLNKVRERGIEKTVTTILQELEQKVDLIYVTVDMDVLDISYAPGVPASTPGGMRTDELFQAVYLAGRSPKVRAFDIVCLDPTKDQRALPTVKAGTYTFLSFLTGYLSKGL